jgi:hypothetical protein
VQRLIDEDVAQRSDVFFMNDHYDIEGLAEKAYQSFGEEKSQINGLERTALSASTFGEVVNFVKSQMGRDTRTGDEWRSNGFGAALLAMLVGDRNDARDEGLAGEGEGHAGRIIEALDESVRDVLQREDESTRDVERRLGQEVARRLRLAYAREYIDHLASHYKYLVSTRG